jgi:xanthine dehydrogenase large subunit
MGTLGKNVPHDSATTHVAGESPFIDDLPPAFGEVLVGLVGSPVAHGNIRAVDLAAARRVPGIVGAFTHADVPGHNDYGPIVKDDRALAAGDVRYLGEPVVLLVAETRAALNTAAKLVKIDVEPLPPIFSIDEARAAESFLGLPRTIACGDVEAALVAAEHRLSGALVIGGQEHFYFESQSAIALPEERGGLTVYSSTQHTTEVQSVVAEVCGLPFHRVTCICRRMGGAFGGKETQAAQPAALAALATVLTKRPARLVFGRDEDMAITGKRHPFKSWYEVGFDDAGRITALKVDHFSDGGCSTDLSPSVLERAMLHTDNAYFLPNARITGRICRTNYPSNTAFRGFGGPQGVAVIENIMEEIAHTLGRDPLEVRRVNLYDGEGRNVAPYGQIVQNNVLPALVEQLRHTSDYDRRRRAIDEANATDDDSLRGLALTAVKFGISFTKRTLNQANALVNIYLDGTVLVSHGGTEMGQGLNTRIRQLVADDLGLDDDMIFVGPTNTDKNHNTSPTAASSGTDLNGAAALDATSRLKQRLAEFAAKQFADGPGGVPVSAEDVRFIDGHAVDRRNPRRRIAWKELVPKAYFERVNLGERGFYSTPGVDFNRETGRGHPFFYYTNGATVAEVCIDRLTGELRVERVDLLMDLGVSINPGIDRGQVVGGFVQGMGWVTTEELKYDDRGHLLSHSPTTYKIPNISDLPPVFNVDFFPNPDNDVSLKRSKAVGEPPLLLGLSVWNAVKNALGYVSGKAVPQLRLPATGEEILLRLTEYAACTPDDGASSAAPSDRVQPIASTGGQA